MTLQPACLRSSGLATLAFTYAPIPFRFAQAGLGDGVATGLITLNAAGASFFGIVMVALFINYPARLPAHRSLTLAAILVFGGDGPCSIWSWPSAPAPSTASIFT